MKQEEAIDEIHDHNEMALKKKIVLEVLVDSENFPREVGGDMRINEDKVPKLRLAHNQDKEGQEVPNSFRSPSRQGRRAFFEKLDD